MGQQNDHTRKTRREGAIAVLRRHHFDGKEPRRFISGVAVSTNREINGSRLEAFGFRAELPVPLLLGHEFMYPLGFVQSIEPRGNQLHFKAEIANARGAYWIDEAWWQLVTGEMTGVSVYAQNHDSQSGRKTWSRWTLDEMSLLPDGADPEARVLRVWERSAAMYLDGRSNEIEFWSKH